MSENKRIRLEENTKTQIETLARQYGISNDALVKLALAYFKKNH